jgi:hypothetical protein
VSERDEPTEEQDLYEEVPPRSVFAATWFRVVLVVIVLGVIGAVAVPFVLDWMNPPPARPVMMKAPAPPTATSQAPPFENEKKDGALIPAPAAPTDSASAPAVESNPSIATARPSDSKPATDKPEPKPPAKPEPKAPAAKADPKPAAAAATDTKTKSPSPAQSAMAAAETETPKPAAAKPAATPKDEAAKPAVASKPAPAAKRAAVASTTAPAATPRPGGPFWVQVGAFKDPEAAKRIAAKLREESFKVEESVTRAGAPRPAAKAPAPAAKPAGKADHYDVFVSGQTAEELNKRLAAKGLGAEASGTGLVVKPSLPLRDAVALSKDLAGEGLKVQVRRAGGAAAPAAPSPAPATSAPPAGDGGAELHRVRVGSFSDRAAALEAVRQLEAKGYKPYIARGDQ